MGWVRSHKLVVMAVIYIAVLALVGLYRSKATQRWLKSLLK